MSFSKKDALASDRTKNIIELGHSEENKTDELEREFFLSKKSQKERNPDDIVDTDTGTDMSETINRDHSEECEEKKEKTCNTKVITTEEDDDDLLQSYTDQLTINEV